jgi:acetylornithine deacetylase/succinyl-diaminopimelate desuccinylase-like protein
MLWQTFGYPNCLTIGAGAQNTAHTSNEYIEIEKLEKLPEILFNIIQKI